MFETWWLVAANVRSSPTAIVAAIAIAPNANGGVERQFSLEARHAFKRHIIGSAATRLRTTEFDGTGLKEREYVNELGVEYFFNREVTLFGRYARTVFDTNAPGGDYTSDAVRIGMRIRK